MANVAKVVRWSLGKRAVSVASFGSGQWNIYFVRILWSPKLGLQLIQEFKTREEAREMAKKIKDHGSINVEEKWEKRFFPSRNWESASSAD